MFILGGYQSDFARHLSREGREIGDLVGECVDGALEATGVAPAEIETIHVGNAFGQLFNGQGQLGAMPATVRPALWGIPASRHEAACASGSVALIAALLAIEAGRYDCALVLGVEQERNVPGDEAARHLGAAAWVGHEGDTGTYPWPNMFSQIADAYDQRWSLDDRCLAAISAKNFKNARTNPRAQTRDWRFDASTPNPIVEGRLRRQDCAQVTDGGAAIVVAGDQFAAAWAASHGRTIESIPRVLGWCHRTAGLGLAQKLARHTHFTELLFPDVARAVEEARSRARRPRETIDGYEVHDCFTATEYMAIDHLGLTEPGRSNRAIESGVTELGGASPINPGGGLIGGGHPVGATGVRMVLDAARQVTGACGDNQIEGAKTIQTLNLGGSATTVVSFIVGV